MSEKSMSSRSIQQPARNSFAMSPTPAFAIPFLFLRRM